MASSADQRACPTRFASPTMLEPGPGPRFSRTGRQLRHERDAFGLKQAFNLIATSENAV